MDNPSDNPNNILRHPAGQWGGQRQQQEPQPSAYDQLNPLPVEAASGYLSRCLTLCAPTGMTVDDRTEWLMAALDAIGEVPASAFIAACQHVQATCDHPAKIIPAFKTHAEKVENDLRRRIAWELDNPWKNQRALPAPAPETKRQMTQADVDVMPPHLVSLGLTLGYLTRDEAGNVLLVEETTDAA